MTTTVYSSWCDDVRAELIRRGTSEPTIDGMDLGLEHGFWFDEFNEGWSPKEAVDNFEESLR